MRTSGEVKLREISLKDKVVFDKYLSLARHELSVYAFENIFIWKALFKIEWAIIEKSLCVFFSDKFTSFLYLPPLSPNISPEAVKAAFDILDKLNSNKLASRIENVEEKSLLFYERLGYDCQNKSYDYICSRSDLANLGGNKFKSKRASKNYFTKHYQFEYLPFSPRDESGCLKLYDSWMAQRKEISKERVYQGMLEDGRRCLRLMLNSYAGLRLTGRIVKVNKEIRGMTFGFKLNSGTFCVLYEVTDLSIKGLAQFIFARLCQELKFRYINIMDDSGLENLKKVKLSYHPVKLMPAYIALKKNA